MTVLPTSYLQRPAGSQWLFNAKIGARTWLPEETASRRRSRRQLPLASWHRHRTLTAANRLADSAV
jgi:hypothetical protein